MQGWRLAMRVLLISHTCQSRTEGQPKAERLARIPGVDLRVLVPDRWLHYGSWRAAQAPEDGAFTYEIGRVAWPWTGPAQCYLHWYPRLGELLRSFKPDIIDLWEEPWGLVSAHACRLRERLLPGARIITETEQNIDKRLPPPFEQFRAYTLRHADFAIGRNTEALALLRAKGYRGPAEVVPNAVDAQLFRPLDRETARRSLDVDGFVAGYVGRLVEEKGLMDLVDALAFCPERVQLLFVGSGPLQSKLERRAEELNRTRQVRFLAALPLERLPSVMNALDVLVLPSRTTPRWKEQFGRVIIEAQACGIPVIGSDSGAIPEVVGQAGHIVQERSPRALGRAIRQLAANPDECARLGALGRVQVETHFTWERVAERMHCIYERLLQDPAPE
jgi:glycosyltransferase involved in cell wall biosynthesis